MIAVRTYRPFCDSLPKIASTGRIVRSGAAEISTETTTTSIAGIAEVNVNSKKLPVISNPEQLTIVHIKANGSKPAAKAQ